MSDIQFTAVWLLLLPVLVFLGWRYPGLRLHHPIRAVTALCLLLIMCQPQIPSRRGGMDLWVLLDRSASTGSLVEQQRREWSKLIEDARPSRRDKVHYIDFAEDAVPALDGGGSELPESRRAQTRLPVAIQYALSKQDDSRPGRILVMTDGFSTEPLGQSASRLAAMGIPLDYRIVEPPSHEDYRITSFDGPTRVQAGEAFILRTTVVSSGSLKQNEIPVTLLRDGQTLAQSTIRLVDGAGSIEWTDRINSGGSHRYQIHIQPENDAYPGNNRAETWVEISAGPRILLVSRYPDDPLATAFKGQGLEVDLRTDPTQLSAASLSGAEALVINNIPSYDFEPNFLKALDFFVRQQGGGLLMVGGKHSFGAGGYFQSAVDELLPVSMELKSDHRKLSLAMVIVLDRSGSMQATAAGAPGLTKMDLANQGAASAIELLGAHDAISVLAVDDRPHKIIPLTQVGKNRNNLIQKTLRIQSSGGGIYVYEGLKGAAEQLRKAKAGTRHIILFADAADAEQPDQYKKLIGELTREGTTISVVGLGTKADPDAGLLTDIAKIGNGRVHFTDNAKDLPQLFAGETVAVARSAFIAEPVGLMPTGEWREVSSIPIEWPAKIDGYNLSYARPGSTVSSISTDEFSAPLVATIRRGLGRTAAISFPMGGEHSEQIRAWPGYNGFCRTLGRWLAGAPLPPGIGLSHRTEGSTLTLNLYYDAEQWNPKFATSPPRLFVTSGGVQPEPREINWARLSLGHFSTSFDMRESEVLRGVVQIGEHTIPFGPLTIPILAEWAFDPASKADLRMASRLAGGSERNDLSSVWERPPVIQFTDLRLPLCIIALLLVLYDAFATKTGYRMPLPSLPKSSPRQSKATKVKRAIKPEPEPKIKEEEPVAEPAENSEPQETDSRRSRFARAKKIRPK